MERVCVRVCVERVLRAGGEFYAWSGAMSCHDSLNLRKEVTLPINYEGTLSSCRDKLGSMRLVSYMTLWHVELRHIQFL
jgi:hypothetical protein